MYEPVDYTQVLCIDDKSLANITTRKLNQLLKGVNKEEKKKIVAKRRRIKNRGKLLNK